jgi:hypothetical protein
MSFAEKSVFESHLLIFSVALKQLIVLVNLISVRVLDAREPHEFRLTRSDLEEIFTVE